MDGPLRGSLAALRVDALIVGGDAVAGRLGYLRGGVRGPALLSAVMRRLERRAATYIATTSPTGTSTTADSSSPPVPHQRTNPTPRDGRELRPLASGERPTGYWNAMDETANSITAVR